MGPLPPRLIVALTVLMPLVPLAPVTTAADALPRSPVIGTDAPVQYEQREDIGAPRKRLPAG